MYKHIRASLAVAAAAIAISASAAAAAAPTWFDGSDRNQDNRVTWEEFASHTSRFDMLDENEDGRITAKDRFLLEGREESSWLYVEYLDTNRSGAVTRAEYDEYLRGSFASFDRNGNGSISAREVDGRAPTRRFDGRDVASRRAARS